MERIRTAEEMLKEDLALMRAGKIKVMSHGFDVTREHMQRLQTVLDKLVSYERDHDRDR